MLKRTTILLFIVQALSATAQGPLDGYLKGKGNLDVAASFSWMHANDFVGGSDQVYPVEYTGNMLSIFAEYGLTEKFDLVASLPYIFTSNQNGWQDGGLYAKYRVIRHQLKQKGYFNVLGGLGASFPLSNYQPVAAGALGQRAVAVPARVIVQWDTHWGPFFNLTGGYNWRLDDYKDTDIRQVQIKRPDYTPEPPPGYATFLLKAGLPTRHFYTDIWLEIQQTSPNKGSNFEPGTVDLPQAYGVSYTQVGGTMYYSENGKRGVFLSGAKMLNGRNISRVLRLTGGVVFKL